MEWGEGVGLKEGLKRERGFGHGVGRGRRSERGAQEREREGFRRNASCR